VTDTTDEHGLENGHTRILKAHVLRKHLVTPHMAELTLQSDDFAKMPDLGPDAFLYVFPPRPGESAPDVDYDFTWEAWRARPPEERQVGRYYTVRRFRPDAGEVDIQMVLHGDGPLTTWASAAQAGDGVALWGPRAGFRSASAQGKWVFVAADDAGLPAAASILESLPSDTKGAALLEVLCADARQQIAAPAGVTISWLERGERTHGELLLRAVREASLPSEDVYAWAAADTTTTVAIRNHLRRERGVPGPAVCAVGYWTAEPPTAAK